MKRSLLFLLILTSCTLYKYVSTEPYSKIFEDLPGTQDELFIKANDWMIRTFTNAESVIEYSDKEAGTLIGKYLMYGGLTSGYYNIIDSRVFAKIDIIAKDNKAMLKIEPMGEWRYDSTLYRSQYKFSPDECKIEMQRLSDSLEESLRSVPIDF